ncbi:MAG: alpha/beta fold hydrolase [Sediminimonas qiaohouensis]|uniref:Alpha/beta fold hydrolase n=1 Tax=Sediminimonas qiaohouensis TaxID=552061 RepID=A0A7C9LMY2_9RHOB|nr:alpha/beta fold hydrolase [Sediminimonas qiaohouensis]MTJ04220.1 alpha/beta fold hydrolase [Sediminimonas qiaohouensis]
MSLDQTVEVDGLSIRYRDTGGSGLAVLLSSGIGGSLELWGKQLEMLGDTHRLIAWDYPGHGLSDTWDRSFEPDGLADFTLRFLDALGIERAVLAGNSLGGATSIRAAAKAPDRAAGLFLAAPAMVGPEVFVPFRLMTLPVLGKVLTKPSDKGVEIALSAILHDPDTVTDDMRDFMRRNQFKEGGAQAFRQTMCETLNLRGCKPAYWRASQDMLATMECPVQFFHGRQDKVLPVSQAQTCHALTPNSALHIADPCGHTPQWEVPEEFNKSLTDFVASVA